MGVAKQWNALRFDALKFADQFVLWAAREWSMASAQDPALPACVKGAFLVAGIPEGAARLHAFLAIVRRKARRRVLFQPVACPWVSREEARFLVVLTAARDRACDDYTRQLLAAWLPPEAMGDAVTQARALGRRVFATLRDRRRPGGDERVADYGFASVLPDPGLARVH